MRTALVAALVSFTGHPQRAKARRFLRGLSADELQFIAGFIGTWILESSESLAGARPELAQRIAEYRHSRRAVVCRDADLDHKTILLQEYLCRIGMGEVPVREQA